MDIIGLGAAACNIVEHFEEYPQYNTYKLDSEKRSGRFFQLKKCSTPEQYEVETPDLSDFFSEIESEISFFVVGSGLISASSLSILEQLKDKNITLYYIQPKINSLTGNKKKLERVTFGILQQYARSGLLDKIVLLSNQKIIDIVGNLPVIGYYKKINDLIASTIHYINIFNRTKHVYGVIEGKENVCRIETIGLLDTESSREKLFYDLDLVREKDYIYALNNEELLNESNIVLNIEKEMQEKKEGDLTKISYRLYSTEYKDNFGFCIFRTSKVQGE